MDTLDVDVILDRYGRAGAEVEAIGENHGVEGNANWHVRAPGHERSVLRRYFLGATLADLTYEYALMDHLARQGWCVPAPIGTPVEHAGRWYCLTRWVPGIARTTESPGQQRQRGVDLARLHAALRSLPSGLGQRPGWRRLHHRLPVMTPIDWDRASPGWPRMIRRWPAGSARPPRRRSRNCTG